MDKVSEALKWTFTFIFYPATVVGVFLCAVGYLVAIIGTGKDLFGRFRRLTAALLPVISLIFVVLWSDQKGESFKNFFLSVWPVGRFVAGALIGVIFVELGKFIEDTSDDVPAGIYALFLSSVGVFVLYSIMYGILGSLQLFLFGMILIGGLDIVFRGPPEIRRSRAWDIRRLTTEELQDRITFNPEQCGGRPCIRGLPIRVVDVLELFSAGLNAEEILREMPDLEEDDIHAALQYAERQLSATLKPS